MIYLLDTHAILWFIDDDSKLSRTAKLTIETADSVYISIASLWEIALKKNKGKLNFKRSILYLSQYLVTLGFELLEIKSSYLDLLEALPNIHSDPFDRLLIVSALHENLIIITKDENIAKYDTRTLW